MRSWRAIVVDAYFDKATREMRALEVPERLSELGEELREALFALGRRARALALDELVRAPPAPAAAPPALMTTAAVVVACALSCLCASCALLCTMRCALRPLGLGTRAARSISLISLL
jgi:hypothetical protein